MTESRNPSARRFAAASLAAVLAVALGLGVLYGTRATPGKDAAAACPAAAAQRAAKLAPLAQGELAGLNVAKTPRAAISLAFNDGEGAKRTLADFHGRAVLVNLWATWCAPCRAEMPALDRLQAKLGGADFEVAAINVDTARLERPRVFLDEIGVKSLARYADPTGDSFEALRLAGKALGLPTTLLIDKDGCELGVVAGPAKWDSGEAVRLIEAMKAL